MRNISKLLPLVIVAVSLMSLGPLSARDRAAVSGSPGNAQQTPVADGSVHQLVGILRSVNGSEFTVQTRSGRVVKLDATAALQAHRVATIAIGHGIWARGTYDKKGVLHADSLSHAKDASVMPANQK